MIFPIELRNVLKNARNLAVLTGAGISAESGVPTFRSPDGIWAKFKPEELANINAFMRNPDLAWEWYQHRRKIVSDAQPNAGHLALVALEQYFEKMQIATQNVDGLHQRAGSNNVEELHGSLLRHRCLKCNKPCTINDEETDVPHCDECGGLIRPGVVWFGEDLPQDAWQRAEQAAKASDVYLTVGTSAVVYPAASLPFAAIANGAYVIEVNPEETEFTRYADLHLKGKAGEVLPAFVTLLQEVRK